MPTVQTYGVKPLRRFQIGKEATAGTLVAPTALLRGEATLHDDTKVENPPEDVGLLVDTDRGYIPAAGGTVTLKDTPATFEQFPYLLEMAIKALATGVADGAGSGKIYTYPFPLGTPQVPNTYSAELGDNALMEQIAYMYCESFKLKGDVDKAIFMSAKFKSRAVAKNSLTATTIAFDNLHHITDSGNGLAIFPIGAKLKVNGTASNNGTYTVTASAAGSLTVTENTVTEAAGGSVTLEQGFTTVAIPAVHDMVFNKSKLYIDNIGGTIGTTQLQGTFQGFEFDYTSGQKGQPAGDGRLDFAFLKGVAPVGKLRLTYEMENGAKAEKAKWQSGSPRMIRILNQGAALTTAGTAYSVYTLILDFIGLYTDFKDMKEDKGDDLVDAELTLGYDITAATAGQLIVVNQLTSLT